MHPSPHASILRARNGAGQRKLLTRAAGLEMVQVIPVCISPMLPNL